MWSLNEWNRTPIADEHLADEHVCEMCENNAAAGQTDNATWVCEDCCIECVECGVWMPHDDMIEGPCGTPLCKGCFEEGLQG